MENNSTMRAGRMNHARVNYTIGNQTNKHVGNSGDFIDGKCRMEMVYFYSDARACNARSPTKHTEHLHILCMMLLFIVDYQWV